MIDNIKGEVTYILRDAKTEEIIAQHTQENIITESLYFKLRNTWQFGFNIVVTNALMESSRYTNVFPGSGIASITTIFPNSVIPALGVYSSYVPSDGINPQYMQVAGRYNAPAIGTSRTINSIGLGARVSNFYSPPTTSPDTDNQRLVWNENTNTMENVMAFLKLTSTCTQTDLQVLDVYYRIFFPITSTITNLPAFVYGSRFVNNDWISTSYGSYPTNSMTFPFKLSRAKTGDENFTLLPLKITGSIGTGFNIGSQQVVSTTLLGARTINYTDTNFTDNAGLMLTSTVFRSNTPTYFSNFLSTSKIQNIIGTGPETTNPLSPSFLDVDNLPSGTGKVFTGGAWNNTGTPSAPGLYYSSQLPEYVKIKITNSGAVGTSQYKIIRQKYFGWIPRSTTSIVSFYRYCMRNIPALCGSGISPNGVNTVYDTNLGLIENVTPTFFDVQQLSACCRFDDSSLVFVKKNIIILYSVGAGDYWKYNAAYTNIHQVAVMNNKIYVACRNTGLWIIDPYNSLTPTNITSPGGGIDLTICNGVAKGNGNLIWVVANNCLASFNGTTWTRYDSTTTPAFTMAGVSDNNWGNIEYLKVDEDSATNQMLLVRKYNATANPTLLGVWWSTAGVTTNTGAETTPAVNSMGRPRVHRGHVGGLGGYWMVLVNNQWNRMSFGGTTFTSITNATAFSPAGDQGYPALNTNNYNSYMQSATFVKNISGEVRSLHFDGMASSSPLGANSGAGLYSGTNAINFQQKTINVSNVIGETLTTTTTGLGVSLAETVWPNPVGGFGGSADYSNWAPCRTSTQAGYNGAYDMGHNFILSPGVMISIAYEGQYSSTGGGQTATWPSSVATKIYNFGLDYTQTGGAMNYTALQEYGWDGSQWVLNNPNGRSTHSTNESLFDGVTLRFENGTAGTSFVTNNFYKFGLCEGLLKDNATRAIYSLAPYYYRKVTYNVTDLESSVVPSSRNGSTGIVGIDVNNTSANVSVNVNNEIIFPGQNVRQYAVGDKPLIGDFVLSIDVTNLNATDVKNAACIGVTRRDYVNSGQMYFGFFCSVGVLYWYDNGTTGTIATITAGTTTSLEIRRVGATLTLWRNGSNVRTMATNTLGIRLADYILDVIYGVWDHRDCTYLPASGTRVPRASITTNSGQVYVNLGNPSTNTGMYSSRFYGIDFTTTGASTVTMNGVTITPKTDGTAPLAGEITVDPWRGTLYFNSADIGKSITANYTVLNS